MGRMRGEGGGGCCKEVQEAVNHKVFFKKVFIFIKNIVFIKFIH